MSPARLSWRGVWCAAVLACGPDAVLSHWSAAALWGLVAARKPVHVSVPHERSGRPALIAAHRSRILPTDERALRDGIPVTSVPRTLLDLAAVANGGTLRRAIEEADRLGLLELEAVRALRRRHRGRRGVRALDRVLADYREPSLSRSELERRFVGVCARRHLPVPALNVIAAGYLVDALWPAQRLVVELDGYAYHRGRAAFEADRARDAALTGAGYRVVRFTYRQVVDEPEAVAARVEELLGR